MMKHLTLALLIAVFFGGYCFPATATAEEARPSRLDIDVHEASAETVLERIASALGMVSGGIEGRNDLEVTMTLRNVTPRTALQALSESLGCGARFSAPERSVTLVCGKAPSAPERTGQSPGLDEKITVSLRDSRLGEVLATRERMSGFEISAPERLSEMEVTLEAQEMAVRQLLDVLCRTNGCSWDQTSDSTIEISLPDP